MHPLYLACCTFFVHCSCHLDTFQPVPLIGSRHVRDLLAASLDEVVIPTMETVHALAELGINRLVQCLCIINI